MSKARRASKRKLPHLPSIFAAMEQYSAARTMAPHATQRQASTQVSRLPAEICIAINRYLAPEFSPHTLHRVAEGGPVTYVFLGREHAHSFLALFSSVSGVPAPSRRAGAAPAATDESHTTPVTGALQTEAMPKSALIIKDEWLEMILSGKKTWEIRSTSTKKRERVALALSGAPLLLGDVEIVDSVKLDAATFAAQTSKHGVPQHRHAEIIGGYKNIFA